jgi:hypothetical protein
LACAAAAAPAALNCTGPRYRALYQRDDRLDVVALDRVNCYPVRTGKATALAAMHDHHALAGTMLDSDRFHQAAACGRPVAWTGIEVL